MCKGSCKWKEGVIAIVVFVLALWPNLLGATVSKWILVIAAIILAVHAFMCKCGTSETETAEKPAPRRRRRK